MKTLKTFIKELTNKDLNPKFYGIPSGDLRKKAADNRKYTKAQRDEFQKEIDMRAQVREEVELTEAKQEIWAFDIGLMDSKDVLKIVKKKIPNATIVKGEESVVYAQSSKALAMMVAKDLDNAAGVDAWVPDVKSGIAIARNFWKHYYGGKYKNDNAYAKGQLPFNEETHSSSKYYVQPNGKWKKGADGRSKGLTRTEVEAINGKIDEEAQVGAPANNTTSGPGMGSDNSLHMKKMRTWKKIHRRHATPEEYLKK